MNQGPTRSALTAISLLVITALAPASGQERTPPAPASGPAPSVDASAAKRAPALSGKERLSEKWTDEQRVDNCKVPPEKRGAKPRPDACQSAPTASR